MREVPHCSYSVEHQRLPLLNLPSRSGIGSFSIESSERWLTFDGMANIVMYVDLKMERPIGPCMGNIVRARIRRWSDGTCTVETQRAKYKHWFKLGGHKESDMEFMEAYQAGKVEWQTKIIEPPKLF